MVFNLKIAEDVAGYQKTLNLFYLNENCNGKIGTYSATLLFAIT
jgi:hypothetical protein